MSDFFSGRIGPNALKASGAYSTFAMSLCEIIDSEGG